MRVAITGGSGFIGTNLMYYLERTEPDTEIVILDVAAPQGPLAKNAKFIYGDIRNLSCLLRAFEDVDEVYNLAGILGTSELTPISSLAAEVNIVGANNVMDASVYQGVSRVYNVAKPQFDGYDENAYTLTKHAGELIGQLYQHQYPELEVATVRWLNAVGPYQHLYPVRKLVPMMLILAMAGHDLEVYGDGTQTIDPIDTRDLARFTVHAIRNLGRERKVVDLGSGKAITVAEAARVCRDVARHVFGPTQSDIITVPMRDGEKPGVNLVADMSYWNSVGMENTYSFEESVIACAKYIRVMAAYQINNALRFYGKAPL